LLGYASVAAMLAATLILELSNAGSSGVEFKPDVIDKVLSVPVAAIVSSSLSLALGWAFLLTGATDCGRRVFLPVAAVFFLQWIFFVGRGGAVTAFLGFGGLLVLGVVTVVHLFSRRSRRWRQYPLAEFSAWLALMLFVVAEVFWAKSPRIAALDLETTLSVPQILSMPFWVLLGVEAVDGAATLARVLTTRIRGWLREGWDKLLVLLFLLVRPAVSIALIENDGVW